MMMSPLFWLAAVVATAASSSICMAADGSDDRNVLLICIDDLRPVLGCYGGAAKTPNLDRFARSGIQFDRHYVQFPSCGPSRSCMFGGVRPDTLQLYGNGGSGRVAERPDERPTLPMHFRNHGYTTLSFGKTFHGKGTGPGFGWSRTPWHPPCGWTCYVHVEPPTAKGGYRPAYEIYDGPDSMHGDYQTADQAIAALEECRDRPFFIAAGFYKPHLPFVAPKRYWELYSDEEVQPVGPLEIPQGAAEYQYGWSEIWSYGDQQGAMFSEQRPPSAEQSGQLIRAYYAAVSFIDAQVGRLLTRLEELGLAEKTAVVVWSDHGFHLGDQARWAKWTQFEADVRSPLIVRLPGVQSTPRSTRALVEAIDLYPTLAEFCGLELPKHLQGRSMVPICASSEAAGKRVAISQVRPLGKTYPHLLAYSIRTSRYRYIEWRDTQQGGRVVDRELYDLGSSTAETVNVAKDPSYQAAIRQCSALLR